MWNSSSKPNIKEEKVAFIIPSHGTGPAVGFSTLKFFAQAYDIRGFFYNDDGSLYDGIAIQNYKVGPGIHAKTFVSMRVK